MIEFEIHIGKLNVPCKKKKRKEKTQLKGV